MPIEYPLYGPVRNLSTVIGLIAIVIIIYIVTKILAKYYRKKKKK